MASDMPHKAVAHSTKWVGDGVPKPPWDGRMIVYENHSWAGGRWYTKTAVRLVPDGAWNMAVGQVGGDHLECSDNCYRCYYNIIQYWIQYKKRSMLCKPNWMSRAQGNDRSYLFFGGSTCLLRTPWHSLPAPATAVWLQPIISPVLLPVFLRSGNWTFQHYAQSTAHQ